MSLIIWAIVNLVIHALGFPIFAYGLDYIVDLWRKSHLTYEEKLR